MREFGKKIRDDPKNTREYEEIRENPRFLQEAGRIQKNPKRIQTIRKNPTNL